MENPAELYEVEDDMKEATRVFNGENFTLQLVDSDKLIVKDRYNEVVITVEHKGERSVFITSSGDDDPGVWTYDAERSLQIAFEMLVEMRKDKPADLLASLLNS